MAEKKVKLKIKVKGSAGDVYTVSFTEKDEKLKVSCTCMAGAFGNLCKHILKAIAKDETAKGIVGTEVAQLAENYEMVQRTIEEKTIEAQKMRERAAELLGLKIQKRKGKSKN